MVFPLLPSDDVILREEVIFACGCTTTRIEHLSGQQASGSLCHGHKQRVVKIVKTIEYHEPNLQEFTLTLTGVLDDDNDFPSP